MLTDRSRRLRVRPASCRGGALPAGSGAQSSEPQVGFGLLLPVRQSEMRPVKKLAKNGAQYCQICKIGKA